MERAAGAEEADGVDGLTRVVREQIGNGADWIRSTQTIAGAAAAWRMRHLLWKVKARVEVAKSAGFPCPRTRLNGRNAARDSRGVETIEQATAQRKSFA